MSKHVSRIAAVAFCAALLMAGCAKQEMVKKDEGIAPAQAKAAPQQAAAKQEPQNVAVKEQPVRQEPVKETAPQQAATDASSLAALKAELQTIYFDFDASTLTDAARSSLARNAEVLKKNATAKIQIAGNCDERGSDEYNLALGEKRAQAAKKYLVTMGVAAERLTTISYGKEKPADAGHDEAAWAKNRRDDFDVLSR
ncbi:peptidoglycan-associated lipoprotein Pal [Geobacter sp.]|uniref:peptidoglycan-associated lipoprotein Pal n=1 Tax=Geobacter sp. TaxID=46610 RepID=UPI00260983CC|nr:peptidoglycan-associated lipoprotein Pal [Geobacter sp.]